MRKPLKLSLMSIRGKGLVFCAVVSLACSCFVAPSLPLTAEDASLTDYPWPCFLGNVGRTNSSDFGPKDPKIVKLWGTKLPFNSLPSLAGLGCVIYDYKKHSSKNDDDGVVCLDAFTGKILWQDPKTSMSIFLADGKLFTLDASYDVKTGKKTSQLYGEWRYVAHHNGRLYLFDGKRLFCQKDGRTVWEIAPQPGFFDWTMCISDGMIFFKTDVGIYCIREDTGKFVWKFNINFKIKNPNENFRGLCVQGQILYFIMSFNNETGNADIIYFNKETGEQLFLGDFSESIGWAEKPAVKDGKLFLTLIGGRNVTGTVFCYDGKSGKKLWHYVISNELFNPPLVSNGLIYQSRSQSQTTNLPSLMCIDMDGKNRWALYEPDIYNPPIPAYGRLYLTSNDGIACFGPKELFVGVSTDKEKVEFGTMRHGESKQSTIRLSNSSMKDLSVVVECDDGLTTSVKKATIRSKKFLDVQVSFKAKTKGLLRNKVSIQVVGGQLIRVPVYGYVRYTNPPDLAAPKDVQVKLRKMYKKVKQLTVYDGMVYVIETNEVDKSNIRNILHCYDLKSLEQLFEVERGLHSTNIPCAFSQGRIISIDTGIGEVYTDVFCFNARTGEELWNVYSRRETHSSPKIENGIIKCGCFDLDLYEGKLAF